MAVSKKILDLINLALQDKVLTHKERHIIETTAMSEGVDKREINALMDNMFRERLKSFAKEELKRCPMCGSQVPLLADDCFFCGTKLETTDSVRPIHVSGTAADVIRAENKRFFGEETYPKNCPDCGAPFPMMSNICTYCGHILHARIDSEANVKNLIDNIEQTTQHLLSAPAPATSFLGKYVIFLFLIMLCVAMPLYAADMVFIPRALAGLLLVIALCVGIPLVALVVKYSVTSREATPEEKQFLYARLDYNKYLRYFEAFYGDNAEAREYLDKLDRVIRRIERKHRRDLVKSFILTVIILMIPFMPHWIPTTASRYIQMYLHNGFTLF